MITHSSKQTESGYEWPRIIRLPLLLPQTRDNPRRQINQYEEITAVQLAEIGLLPAEPVPILTPEEEYGSISFTNGRVAVLAVPRTIQKELQRLRSVRNNLLYTRVDPFQLVMRYQTMVNDQQDELQLYRLALLNWPNLYQAHIDDPRQPKPSQPIEPLWIEEELRGRQ